jgi:hypothetical protein
MALGDLYGMGTGAGTAFGTGTIPTGSTAGIWGDTDILSTFAGSPAALWQAARIRQMGQQAAIPQFQQAAMQGFTPALGQYLLGATPDQTFAQYHAPTAAGYSGDVTQPQLTNWQAAVQASKALDPSFTMPTGSAGLTAQQVGYQGLLTGENARRNAIAMATAAMGGGAGYVGQAQQAAVGNLYDLYKARAAGAGAPAGGFLGYLGGVVQPQWQ